MADVVIIGGLGHVGLPLGLVLAESGFQVTLVDRDLVKGHSVSRGEMPFMEEGAEELLKKHIGGRVKVVPLGDGEISQAKHVIITIGTPLDEHGNPSLIEVSKLMKSLAPQFRAGQHVMLRSTVYPGTTRKIHEQLKALGCDVHLTFCPERIVQGKAITELKALPQIVSGFSRQGVMPAYELFRQIAVSVIDVGVEEAELAKLFSNAWRYIRFAAANQLYLAAAALGADYEQVHSAMTDGYVRGDIPLPGFAAGPCLLKDTLQLAATSHFPLGMSAVSINEGMPRALVDRLKKHVPTLDGVTVGILGMAFKADNDDIRDSLSFKLRKILTFEGASVLCSDEFAKSDEFVTKEELLDKADVVIIGVPHSSYRKVLFKRNAWVVDMWNATRGGGKRI